jgi:alanine racemase
MIRNMVKAFTLGVMADNIVVNGQTVSSTGRVSTDMLMVTAEQVYGTKVNGRYGLMNSD